MDDAIATTTDSTGALRTINAFMALFSSQLLEDAAAEVQSHVHAAFPAALGDWRLDEMTPSAHRSSPSSAPYAERTVNEASAGSAGQRDG